MFLPPHPVDVETHPGDEISSSLQQNNNVKQFFRMLDALAFLPAVEVPDGMAYLRGNIPEWEGKEQLEQLLNYFDRTYLSGSFRSIQRPNADGSVPVVHLRRIPPLYPPNVWNVHDATIFGTARTNNFNEGWKSSFRQFVGRGHPAKYIEGVLVPGSFCPTTSRTYCLYTTKGASGVELCFFRTSECLQKVPLCGKCSS